MSQFPPSAETPKFDDPVMMSEPPGWPKVVGILCIVWGGFWLLCGGCGLAALPMQEWGMAQNPEMKKLLPIPEALKPGMMQMGLMAFGMLLDVLVIAAGIATIKRSASARAMCLGYAGLAFVVSVAAMGAAIYQTGLAQEWLKANPGSEWKKFINPQGNLLIAVGLTVVTLSFPGFLAVWFGFIKPKHKDMLESAPPAP